MTQMRIKDKDFARKSMTMWKYPYSWPELYSPITGNVIITAQLIYQSHHTNLPDLWSSSCYAFKIYSLINVQYRRASTSLQLQNSHLQFWKLWNVTIRSKPQLSLNYFNITVFSHPRSPQELRLMISSLISWMVRRVCKPRWRMTSVAKHAGDCRLWEQSRLVINLLPTLLCRRRQSTIFREHNLWDLRPL